MALETIAISLGVSLLGTGIQYLLQPTPKTQKIGGSDPLLPKIDYGSAIPVIYGKVLLSGFFLWPNKKEIMFRQETTTESSGGGKGFGGRRGKTEKTETYSTFAVLFCEGVTTCERIIIKDNRYDANSSVWQNYFTFFDGTQTTAWSAIQNLDEAPYTNQTFEGFSYLGIQDLPSEYYDLKVDAILESVDFPENPDLGLVVKDLCGRQIRILIDEGKAEATDYDLIDVSELIGTPIQRGLIVTRSSGDSYKEAIELLKSLYLFTGVETNDGKIKFKFFQRPQDEALIIIPPEHFIFEDDDKSIYQRDPSPKEKEGIPSEIIFKYIEEPEYIEVPAKAYFAYGEKNKVLNLSTNLVSKHDIVQNLISNQEKFLAVWQKNLIPFKIPAFYRSQLEGLELILLPNGEIVQIYDINSGNDYLLRVDCSNYGGELNLQQSPITPSTPLDDYVDPNIPNVYILDIPQIEDYPPSTLYVLATEIHTGLISLDGGVTTTATIDHLAVSTIGDCLTALPNNGGGLDQVNTLDIELESGSVEGISQEQFDNSHLFNLALIAIQYPDGYYNGKFIQFRDVQALGNNQYRLSYTFQGWYSSENFDTSSLPLKFFLLKGNGAYYSTIQGNSSFIGQNITYTPFVYSAQNLGTTPTTGFTPSGNAYKPPSVFNASAEEDSQGNIRFTWEYLASTSSYNNQSKLEDISFAVVIGNSIRTIYTTKQSALYLIPERTADGVNKPFTATIYAINNIYGRSDGVAITVNTTPQAGVIFGTGEDGFVGIKFFTNLNNDSNYLYIVTEADNNWILKFTTVNGVFTNLYFPSSLSNGFECQVIATSEPDSNLNSRIKFVNDPINNTLLLTPEDQSDILAGSTVNIAHAGGGNFSILGNNRQLIKVNNDNSIARKKTVSLLPLNYVSPNPDPPINQSIILSYTDAGDLLEVFFAVNDDYINNLIQNNSAISNLQTQIDNLEILVNLVVTDVANLQNQVAINTTDITNLTNQVNSLVIPTDESIQDMLSSFLVEGSNITLTYDDTANTLTIASAGGGGGSVDPEQVQDIVSTLLVAGSNITLDYSDIANTLTISSATGLTAEQIQDMLNTFLVAGSEIDLVYNDGNNTLTINSTAVSGLGAEEIQDMLNTFLIAGNNINLTYDDVNNTLTIDSGVGGQVDIEAIQDMLSTFLVAGIGVSLNYDDTANTLTINSTAISGLDAEQIQDMLSTFLVAGSNISLNYSDTANTLTINAVNVPTTESIQDLISTFLVAGSNITLNYDDVANTLTISSTATDTEAIQDMLSTFLVAGSNITLNYDDVANTLTINSTATDTEAIQDMLSTFLVAGTNVDLDYDDTANTLTINSNTSIAGGLSPATDYTINLTSVANNATATVQISMPTSHIVYKVTSNVPVRIRAYLNDTYRQADISRPSNIKITGDHGCYYDIITTVEKGLIRNLAPPPISLGEFFTVTNLSGGTSDIAVTITALTLEA